MQEDRNGGLSARREDRSTPGFSWLAVLVGAATGVGAPYLIGSVVYPLLQQWVMARGGSLESLAGAMTQSTGFNVLSQLLSAFGGVAAGYVAARLGYFFPAVHAAAAALVMMAAAALLYLGAFPSPYPVWSQILGFVTPIPCAVLGAWLFARSLD
jgi:hypothetical protein